MPSIHHLYRAKPEELTSRARVVYMYLKDRSGRGKECWPAINTIAKDLALSRSTVKRALKDLEMAGILEKEARFRENGSGRSSLLHLKR